VRLIRTDLGVDVLCAGEQTGGRRRAGPRAGAVAIEEATAETLRIERGRPRFGVEIDETTMPQEAACTSAPCPTARAATSGRRRSRGSTGRAGRTGTCAGWR
jgi:hypothetical protein